MADRLWAPCNERTDRDLTERQMQAIRSDLSYRVTYRRAVLNCNGERYVMTGPSGTHSLSVDVTDLLRLNAHWQVFATDPRNA